MADSYAKIGGAGVVLVENEYFPAEGALDSAQNAELRLDTEQGGEPSLAKRGGYTSLGSALAGSIAEMVEIRFIDSV